MFFNRLYITLLLFLLCEFSMATKYYVNDNSTTGDIFCTFAGSNLNNGTSTTTPKASLTNLLTTYSAVLTNGDSIFIDAGTYTSDISLNITTAGLHFIGAGSQTTIFDNNFAGTNTNYFMYINANNVTLKNMTIKRYTNIGTYTPAGKSGQAITINGAAGFPGVILENIFVQDNGSGSGSASIIVLDNSTVTLKGSGSMCNGSTMYGGGVDVLGANITLVVDYYVISNNNKQGATGGAMSIVGNNTTTKVILKNSFITNNYANEGGGIHLNGGDLKVYDCIFDANSQNSSYNYGGAIFIEKGIAYFTRSKFTSNIANKGGAIAVNSAGGAVTLAVDSCYFSANSATGKSLYARVASSNSVTVNCFNSTFSTVATQITNPNTATINLTKCGSPSTSGTVSLVNTTAPSYTANPTYIPTFTGTCGSIVLPIDLLYFKGVCNNNKVELRWQTASEKNNYYFQIERSLDGVNFNQIAIVEGSGNSNSVKNYAFNDTDILKQSYYYRLVQFDYDGQKSISNIIYVSINCIDKSLEISNAYFNSFTGDLAISFLSNQSENIDISVVDIFGRLIFSKNQITTEGYNDYRFNVGFLSKGIYIITISNQLTKDYRKARF